MVHFELYYSWAHSTSKKSSIGFGPKYASILKNVHHKLVVKSIVDI